MAGKSVPIRVVFTGSTADLEAAFDRAAVASDEANNKMVYSARSAAAAAVEQAKQTGASADDIVEAAAKGATAYEEASKRISSSAVAAGAALAEQAKNANASITEQSAAYDRGVAAVIRLEDAQKRATEAAKVAGAEQVAAAKAAADAQAEQAAKMDLLQGKMSGLGEKTTGLASEISKLGGIGFGASIAGMGDLAAKFQTSTHQIAANSDISAQAAMGIGKAFLATSGQSIFSAKDMADAFARVAGQLRDTEGHALSAAQATRVMAAADNLAEATSVSLSDSTSALATVMQSFHLSVGQASSASDTLFNVSRALNVPLDTVAASVNKLHGRLGTLAPSLSDVGGLMIDLSQHGIQGSRGIQVANTAMQTLIGGSQNVDQVLNALGVNIFNAQGKFVGLQNVISQLRPKMADLSQQNQDLAAKTLFGSAAAQVMLGVIDRGPDEFQAQADAAGKAGTAAKAAAEQNQTLGKQLDILKATVDNAATSLGLKLLPALTSMTKGLESGVQWLMAHKQATEDLAIAIGTVLAGAVSVFAYEKATAFLSSVGKMGEAMIGLGTKVKTSALGIGSSMGTAAGEVETSDAAIVASADATAAGVDTAIGSTGLGLILIGVGVAATELALHWKTAWEDIESVTQRIVTGLKMELNGLITAYNDTFGVVLGDIGKLNTALPGTPAKSLEGKTETRHGVVTTPVETGMTLSKQWQHAATGISGLTPTQQSNAAAIMAALTRGGLSTAGAAAVTGNWVQESGLNPSEPGGLLAQWGGSRLTGEAQYAKQHGQYLNSIPAETGFALQELQGYPSLLADLKAGKMSPQQLALMVSQQYERPNAALANNPRRESSAENIFKAFKGAGTKSQAAATAAIPAGLTAMLATAQALVGTKYTLGGGHNGWDPVAELKKIGVDCSGFVSQVLHAGGVSLPGPLTTTGLAANLKPGVGKQGVTVYDRATGPYGNQHTLINLGGQFYESGGSAQYNPSGGVSKLTAAQARGELSGGGFKAYHPASIAGGGKGSINLQSLLTATSPAAKSGQTLLATLQSALETGSLSTLRNLTTPAEQQKISQQEGALRGAGDTKLANQISSAMKQIFQTLSQSMLANQINYQAQALANQAQELQDQTQLVQDHGQDQLNVMKAQQQQRTDVGTLGQAGRLSDLVTAMVTLPGRVLNSQDRIVSTDKPWESPQKTLQGVTSMKDASTAVVTTMKNIQQTIDDAAAASVTNMKNRQQLADDTAANVVTHIQDMTQTVTDQMALAVAALKDAATVSTDQSKGIVDAITDSAQTTADTLGEKGLYGLNLVAQQLTVQSDVIKAGFDQQIDAAQQNLDVAQMQADLQESSAQVALDQVTATQHTNVALAQEHMDLVTQQQDQKVAQAQAHMDQVTTMQDAKVARAQAHMDQVTAIQDERISRAQAHSDAVTLHMDTSKVGPAQTALDLNANASQSVQALFQAQLASAQGQAGKSEGSAQLSLANVTNSANSLIQTATNAYDDATSTANKAIQQATDAYDSTSNSANRAIQVATDAYNTANDKANIAIQNSTTYLTNLTNGWNLTIQNLQNALTGIQNQANIGEAAAAGKVTTTQAEASTEFAGSGLVVNMYGMDLSNAGNVAQEMSWAVRSSGLQVA